MQRFFRLFILAGVFSVLVVPFSSAQPGGFGRFPQPVRVWPGMDMDYGPFLSYSVIKPRNLMRLGRGFLTASSNPSWNAGDLLATKGITVKLSPAASICFDIDTCRFAAGWTGGFLDLTESNLVRSQGPSPALLDGRIAFETVDGPAWAKDGSFKDPRHRNSDSRLSTGEGPLPRDWSHYKGLYRDGEKVVFSYTVGNVEVLDMPGIVGNAQNLVFRRTIHIGKSTAPMLLALAGSTGPGNATSGEPVNGILSVQIDQPAASLLAAVASAPAGAVLRNDAGLLILQIPPTEATTLVVYVASLPRASVPAFTAITTAVAAKIDEPAAHTKGGPARWKQEIETTGTLAAPSSAYVVDTVALPDNNPWKSWMKPGGFDFFPDGRMAVCTLNGDVWIVSGLDEKLQHVKWKRFAAGLYEPLGLKIVDNRIYVLDRSGIVRLHDLNDDGEADFYENFNSDMVSDANYHSFHTELQADREGNFYYTVSGNQMALAKPDSACIVKVSKYGDKAEIIATGLRASNGMGMGPNDELTMSDNQGHWLPASPIYMVTPGAFYGFHGDPKKVSDAEFAAHIKEHPITDPPMLWVPYNWDNSAGGEVWAGDKFGPLSGHMLHASYGRCMVFEILTEQVEGTWQGAAVLLPGRYDSGIMRGRVNPVDGQVWLGGLRGWQTNANKDGCLQRLRYTGKPFYLPTAMHVTDKGIRISFDTELDPEAAADAGGYGCEIWTYKATQYYGGDDLKISNPNVRGHDSLEVRNATLSADKKSVLIAIQGLTPVTQFQLKMRLAAADGTSIKCDLAGSIHKLARE